MADGWRFDRTDGDQEIWKREKGEGRVVVPKGRGELPTGTAHGIARQAGWTKA
jgi:predicted RNA binding protein YcfA (HicA-like mRNA interferase family)